MKNTNKKAACTFILTGEVTDIFEGKQNDHLTIKADRGDYYDLFHVAASKDSGVEVGDKLTIAGRVETFYNKDKKVSVYNFYAENIKEQ